MFESHLFVFETRKRLLQVFKIHIHEFSLNPQMELLADIQPEKKEMCLSVCNKRN